MAVSAVALAKAAGYSNAGTVEFLVDAQTGDYYFLEMNARIQVEHPITEETLKLDMVDWQCHIASGESITLPQDEVRPSGHAEDPYANFAPSTGRLLAWRPPSGMGIRLDSGVAEGFEITPFYNSMLSRLVAWGPDRQASIGRMLRALESFPVIGVATNIPFLIRTITHPAFRSGDYDTGFIAKHPELTAAPESERLSALAAGIAERLSQTDRRDTARRTAEMPRDAQGPWHGLPKSMFP